MSTLFNCTTVIFGEHANASTMHSLSSFEASNSSFESSQDSGDPMVLGSSAIHNIRSLLSPTDYPFLQVTEEPVEKFRFRYKSEMMGTHGSILARSHERNRRKVYPSVQLCNYDRPAIIRCSLYTANQMERLRTPHTHRLIVRAENNTDKDDPHEMIVSPDNNYTAIFHGMGIIHTAKKNIVEELIKKKRARLLEKLPAQNNRLLSLSTTQEAQLRQEAEEEARKMNLNSVSLCFEAFQRDSNNCLHLICPPIFSKPINNMKSALTGELKICRIDKYVSSCLGGEEVYILVEKVGKKNIKIKFFEVDEDDNEIWSDFGKFSELDVHHQYAIVFRTPPYRDQEIEKSVDVFVQLYRPTDGDTSEPIKFQYKPSEKMGRTRKRQRITNESFNSADQNLKLLNGLTNGLFNNNIEIRVDNGDQTKGDTFPNLDNISEILEADNHFDSSDFREFMKNLSLELNQPLPQTGMGSIMSENLKMPAKYDLDPVCTAAFICNPSDMAFPAGLKTEGIVTREYFDCLHPIDLACDGEQTTPKVKEVPEKQQNRNNTNEKKRNDKDILVTVKQEPMGDMALLQQSLDNLEKILTQSLSPALLSKKVQEVFSIKNEEEENALHAAVMAGQKDSLALLLQVLKKAPQASVLNLQNCNAETPLHLAALNNQPNMVKMLIHEGADPNIVNKSGNTAIHVAIENGHHACLTELLNKKNYINNSHKPMYAIKNDNGDAPLHISALKNNLFAVKSLVEAGVNVNDVDSSFGRHALHIAAEQGHKDIVEYLVKETKIDVNLTNNAGNTALHYACVVDGKGSSEICALLIQAKANPHIVNYEQRSKTENIQASLGTPDFLKVDIKEEIESEDDLQLHIDDDEEEDNDGEEEPTQGQSSLDLAWNNKEILEILKKAEVTHSVLSDGISEIHIKKECESPSDPGPSDAGLFDEETLVRLCNILDVSDVWINLADLLDYTFLVPSIRNATSPSKLLFNYADLHGNVTVQNIRSFLEAMDETEAVEVIDLMLARRISNESSV